MGLWLTGLLKFEALRLGTRWCIQSALQAARLVKCSYCGSSLCSMYQVLLDHCIMSDLRAWRVFEICRLSKYYAEPAADADVIRRTGQSWSRYWKRRTSVHLARYGQTCANALSKVQIWTVHSVDGHGWSLQLSVSLTRDCLIYVRFLMQALLQV